MQEMNDLFEMAAAAADPETLVVIDDDEYNNDNGGGDDDDDDGGDGNNVSNDDSRSLIDEEDMDRLKRNNTDSTWSPPLFTPESQKRRRKEMMSPPQKQQNLIRLIDEDKEQQEKDSPIKYSLIRDSGVGMCSICYCPFDEDMHLMSCLRCGHIFGKACIVKWLNSKSRNEKVCPICKIRSNPSQIIVLYAPQLTEPSVPPDENENRKLRLDIIEAKRQNFLLFQTVTEYIIIPHFITVVYFHF